MKLLLPLCMYVDDGNSSGVDDLQDDFEEQTITKQGMLYGDIYGT